uniref:Uncharacterized protein n=1 Tax=Peronospora matthiolae TaxID=2874970 RepID=A0AAV1VER9_9STRA
MRDARGGSDSLVLDNIVHHASPELIDVMMAKYDSTRPYYMRHVEGAGADRSVYPAREWRGGT